MSILPIVTYNDPILREKTKEVVERTEGIEQFIEDLIETMYHSNGLGLAAPQVGASHRMFVFDPDPMLEEDEEKLEDEIEAATDDETIEELEEDLEEDEIEKDDIDEEGNPEYQAIDQSKFVPLLTGALQEALTRIEELETKVAALEAAN